MSVCCLSFNQVEQQIEIDNIYNVKIFGVIYQCNFICIRLQFIHSKRFVFEFIYLSVLKLQTVV